MENMDNKANQTGHPEGCRCMVCTCRGCGCRHWGGRFSLLRVLIGIIILIFVFCAGFALGDLKGSLQGYGRHSGYRMMGTPYYMNYPGQGMMRGYYGNSAGGVGNVAPQATGTAPAAK